MERGKHEAMMERQTLALGCMIADILDTFRYGWKISRDECRVTGIN